MKILCLVILASLMSGCQVGYLLRAAKGHIAIINQRVPLSEALENEKVNESDKRKLKLASEAKHFAEEQLGLKKTDNYSTYVLLDRPYVSYVVGAAQRWKLQHHLWKFPFVGEVPYKGFYSEAEAQEEADLLKQQGLDVYWRGVSAYSTLGWFSDPILSSMMRYSDHDLVNTIIHETVHATIYIKSQADFNERLATFLGNKGAEAFYVQREGAESPTVAKIRRELEDDTAFSKFISQEIKTLEQWYNTNQGGTEDTRIERLKAIQSRYTQVLKPELKSNQYDRFATGEINNARLMVFKTYVMDLNEFETVFQKLKGDYRKFVELMRTLESHKDPEAQLRAWATGDLPMN